jgi:hypothetical protein
MSTRVVAKSKKDGGKSKSQFSTKKPQPTNPNLTTYKSSYQFLEGVGEFVKSKLNDKYPTTWGGFNACMTPIPSLTAEKKFLFVSRVFMTFDMIFSNKIILGSKYNANFKVPRHMRPHDWSNSFFWANWNNGVEMSIMFVATFDSNKGITLDTTYTPFLLNGCKSSFQKPPCVYSQSKEIGIPRMLLNPSFQLAC